MNDLINRQDAIDMFEPWLNVIGYSEGEINMLRAVIYELQNIPSADITEQLESAYAHGYTAAEANFHAAKDIATIIENEKDMRVIAKNAEPEIIRCKDCKHNSAKANSGNADCEIYYGMCDQFGYCHRGEKR